MRLDSEEVIEHALENGDYHDGAGDSLSEEARVALAKALSEWNAKYGAEVTTYHQDPDLVLDFGA